MNPIPFSNTAYIFQKIYEFFTGAFFPNRDSVMAFFGAALIFIKPLSILLSLLFLTGIIYCSIRTRAVLREMEEKTHGAGHGAVHTEGHAEASGEHADTHHGGVETVPDKRWMKITEHINSESPSDWRLAILECDIILDEMLGKMSYRGETLSDKLKAVEKSDFLSIDKAWEAHRVRNAIAHEGSNFQITDREARRVVGLYEEVFREFHYI